MAKQKIQPAYNVKVLYASVVILVIAIIIMAAAFLNPTGFFCLLSVYPSDLCGGGGGGGGGSTLSISLSPSSGTLSRGSSTTSIVYVDSTSSQSINLSVSGCTAIGAYCYVNPVSGFRSFQSTLYIYTYNSTLIGTYPIAVTATGGGITKTATYTLTIV